MYSMHLENPSFLVTGQKLKWLAQMNTRLTTMATQVLTAA